MYDSVVEKRRIGDRDECDELKMAPQRVVERRKRKRKSKAKHRMILCRSDKVG